jgi:hypothetical protein
MLLIYYDNNELKYWATNIKQLLYTNGLGYVWNNQGDHNKKLFLKFLIE